jgi:hypothetical protein
VKQKAALEQQKEEKLKTQIYGKVDDISSTDENKKYIYNCRTFI